MKLKKTINLINKIDLPTELINIIINYSGVIKDYYSSEVLSYLWLHKKDSKNGFTFNTLEDFQIYLKYINDKVTDKYNTVTIFTPVWNVWNGQ